MMFKTRTKPMYIRFRLSEIQEKKLIECHKCHGVKCSYTLYAQQLFNTALNAMYYDTQVRNGKIERSRKK